MVQVKICGIRTEASAAACAEAHADLAGLNFVPTSRRAITPERAAQLTKHLGPVQRVGVFMNPTLDDVKRAHALVGLHYIQLHGDEPPPTVESIAGLGVPIIKALRRQDEPPRRQERQGREEGRGPNQTDRPRAPADERETSVSSASLASWRFDPNQTAIDGYAPFVAAFLLDASEPGSGKTFDWTAIPPLPRPFFLAGGLTPENVARAIAATRPHGVDTASGVEEDGVPSPARIRAFVEAARGAE